MSVWNYEECTIPWSNWIPPVCSPGDPSRYHVLSNIPFTIHAKSRPHSLGRGQTCPSLPERDCRLETHYRDPWALELGWAREAEPDQTQRLLRCWWSFTAPLPFHLRLHIHNWWGSHLLNLKKTVNCSIIYNWSQVHCSNTCSERSLVDLDVSHWDFLTPLAPSHPPLW